MPLPLIKFSTVTIENDALHLCDGFCIFTGVKTYFQVYYTLLGAEKDTSCTLEVPVVLLSLAALSLLVSARDYQLKSSFSFCVFNRKKKYLFVFHCISWFISEVRKFFCFFSHLYFLLYKLLILVLHPFCYEGTHLWLVWDSLFAKDVS